MIGVIARKEMVEYRRDGRILALLGLTAALLLIALFSGWATQDERRRQAEELQLHDQATFVKQGDKPIHSAAHFGRMAYKPVPALAAFDPGSTPYLGQVVWLEAHRQGPAMFRPAEDALELRRLADLSVAGILTLLLPLVIFLLAHAAVAGERERDTWVHVLASGATHQQLFFGKFMAATIVALAITLTTLGCSFGIAAAADPQPDTLFRAAGLVGVFVTYGLMICAIALAVSARAGSSASALLILLGAWATFSVIAPRLATDVADHLHPTPDSATFWKQTSDAMRDSRPKRGSDEYRKLERDVLSRALGRTVSTEELSTLSLNRQGLSLEIGEIVGARAFESSYQQLYQAYEAQRRVRRWFGLLTPTISLQHVSSALAATDLEAHRDFTRAAEEQRRHILRLLNEDLMLRDSGRQLWKNIPNFEYRSSGVAASVRHVIWDIVILMVWAAAALFLAWRSVVRQRSV